MNYVDYVNIKQGSRSTSRYSNGSTSPLVQLPHGMVAFAQQTNSNFSRWYSPDDDFVEGIRITHQPSPWIPDYGCLLITPQSDIIRETPLTAHSGMDRRACVMKPHYMKTEFIRSGCIFEVVPTERCARLRMSFHGVNNFVSLFAVNGSAHFEVTENRIFGYTFDSQHVRAKDFHMYFELIPNVSIDAARSFASANDAGNAAIHAAFADSVREVEFELAISYISAEQARLNLRELAGKSFDELVGEGEAIWNDRLGRIKLKTDDTEMLRTFYSCMYRTFLFPHMAHELDKTGTPVHYSPFTGELHAGKRYTGNGFWDTYRTNYPLYSMINRELYADLIESLLHDFEESGWIPRWTAMGENGCMPSTLVDSVIAEAVVCGIGSRETHEKLLFAMIKHAETPAPERIFGREGIDDYIKLGYVPCDKYSESVNLTLDFAYGDYCIAKVADLLGYTEIRERYLKRAENYKNIFDAQSGFMRGRNSDGSFVADFDPFEWSREYTEASAWQTHFAVPHDLDGLEKLMASGKISLLERLDQLFATDPRFRVGSYKTEIHEMIEMVNSGRRAEIGMCEINNQPGFSLPFIYAYFGRSDVTRAIVKRICERLYSYAEDGFPGDEDNGSAAAWYIFSVMGKYPICPARDEYVEFEPLCEFKIDYL